MIFKEIIKNLNFDAIIETGTYRGTTTEYFSHQAGLPLYSCELEVESFWYSYIRLFGHRNVKLCRMDSRRFLENLCRTVPAIARPFCYLDAHWNIDLPLWDEVNVIWKRWPNAVIMIDDFAVPGDAGYSFDEYGPGKSLTIADLRANVAGDYRAYFPKAPSENETGLRRGLVVLANSESNFITLDKAKN